MKHTHTHTQSMGKGRIPKKKYIAPEQKLRKNRRLDLAYLQNSEKCKKKKEENHRNQNKSRGVLQQ